METKSTHLREERLERERRDQSEREAKERQDKMERETNRAKLELELQDRREERELRVRLAEIEARTKEAELNALKRPATKSKPARLFSDNVADVNDDDTMTTFANGSSSSVVKRHCHRPGVPPPRPTA